MELPTTKRHNVGLGVNLGKKRRTHAFEEDGDEEESDDEVAAAVARKRKKHEKEDLGNIGFAQHEKKLMQNVMSNQEEGVIRYGGEDSGKWEEKDEVLEPFNLKTELEQGRFDDETGVYVENEKEAVDPRDAWLDDFADRNGGKFAEEDAYYTQKENEPRKSTQAEMIQMKKDLASMLNRGETVAKGLKRLRKEKTAFEAMTELADKLLNNGDYGIYSISKEDLEDAVDAATAAATAAIANVDDADTWEYKISINDQQVHGPFSSEHMQAWMDQGYFKEKPVWVRRVSKQQKQDFKSSDEIDMFSMY